MNKVDKESEREKEINTFCGLDLSRNLKSMSYDVYNIASCVWTTSEKIFGVSTLQTHIPFEPNVFSFVMSSGTMSNTTENENEHFSLFIFRA